MNSSLNPNKNPWKTKNRIAPNNQRLTAAVAGIALLSAGAVIGAEVASRDGSNSVQAEMNQSQDAVIAYNYAVEQANMLTTAFTTSSESRVDVRVLNGELEPILPTGKNAKGGGGSNILYPILLSAPGNDPLNDGYVGVQSTNPTSGFEYIVQPVNQENYKFVAYDTKNPIISVELISLGGKGGGGIVEDVNIEAVNPLNLEPITHNGTVASPGFVVSQSMK